MRTKFVFLFLLVATGSLFSQVSGDYRTSGNTNLNTNAGWQVYNGTTWAAATVSPYAASFTNTNTITILNHTVSTAANGSISPANLIINGTLNISHSGTSPYLNTGNTTINGNSGTLNISNNRRINVQGNVIVNSGGTFSVGNGNSDSAIIVVYGNYTNDGTTKFGMAEVAIVGNLNSNTASQIQNNGNLIVGGDIIGIFINQGSGGQFYFLDPNATINITIQGGNSNVTPINGFPANYTNLVEEVFGTCLSLLTTTWDGSAWSKGLPNNAKTIEIAGPYTGASFDACKLIVTASGSLTIADGNFVNVRHDIVNNGTITIQNGGSLVQIEEDATYTGNNLQMTRVTRTMKGLDYVYWGSPVQENVTSQIPADFDRKYVWNLNGTMDGSWVNLATTTPGRGFITRVKNIAPYNAAGGTLSFTFNGKPNNGTIAVAANIFDGSSDVSGNTILLANPYPSAIDATRFLRNSINQSLQISTLYLWTSNTLYTGGSYSQSDYASWNLTGSTTTSTTPLENLRPNGKIAAGQGFFAKLFVDGNVRFDNSMRILQQSTSNTTFYRTAVGNTTQSDTIYDYQYPPLTQEYDRYWINIKGANSNMFRQLLVGYIEGASNDLDLTYDAMTFTSSTIDIYTIVDGKNATIQGRALPFTNQDVVTLGYKVPTAGTYTFELDSAEGLFDTNQAIYIKDTTTETYHNLKEGPFTFTSIAGTFNERFQVHYINPLLSVNNPVFNEESVVIYGSNKTITAASTAATITGIEIYDVLGKRIYFNTTLDTSEFVTHAFDLNAAFLIVKLTLENNKTVTRKIILQ
ncbi:T9SS type A sorting domain-containing protein [Flavobacterium orientale]|uniref:Por secretion system C-terminal sorting domain-containing protein n=1 Tax=Flavobacterium orientale TaxID=1756020 RepID=A0A916XXX7_9FLAO|nr:T9SS type A sorting domain-containing protein [Flavobacterium orientale]GGD18453.1 hypothetical protein GCM10011343_06360 [Flavobacterium orientale]